MGPRRTICVSDHETVIAIPPISLATASGAISRSVARIVIPVIRSMAGAIADEILPPFVNVSVEYDARGAERLQLQTGWC